MAVPLRDQLQTYGASVFESTLIHCCVVRSKDVFQTLWSGHQSDYQKTISPCLPLAAQHLYVRPNVLLVTAVRALKN